MAHGAVLRAGWCVMKPTPLSVHMANLTDRRQPPHRAVFSLGFEWVCLLLTGAGVTGMFLGMVLKGAFG